MSRLHQSTAVLVALLSLLGLACGGSDVNAPEPVATTIAPNGGNNQSAATGTAVTDLPSVKVTDANTNPVSGVAVTFAVASGGGSITGASQTTNESGIATVGGWTLGSTPGPNTLTATATGLTGSPVTFTATATAPATNIAINGGNNQFAVPGAAVATAPSVLVTDASASPVSGVAVTFAVASGGGSITAASQVTDASGIATVGSWTLGSIAGTNTLTATAVGLTGSPVTFTATAGAAGPQSLLSANAYSCGLSTAGAAYCWGYNETGAVGDGTTTDQLIPVAVEGGLVFGSLAVSAGGSHTCGLTPAGAAYCWGFNPLGQLGDGTTEQRLTPVPVSGGLTFQNLAVGFYHTCGVATGGAAYCWGRNTEGQLGDGTTTDRLAPRAVSGGLQFQSLTADGWHTCGITASGTAYCWGDNGTGGLGDGTTTDRSTPVLVAGGLVFRSLAAGGRYTCGVTTGAAAYCWGNNEAGQLGDGTTTQREVPVALTGGLTFESLEAGGFHTCGVISGGLAYCWGSGFFSQLGSGVVAITSPDPVAVAGGRTYQSVSAGYSHSCGLTTDRIAYCWGFNGRGGLGDGTTEERALPEAVHWPSGIASKRFITSRSTPISSASQAPRMPTDPRQFRAESLELPSVSRRPR
jgi:alpha-tubulin suppressor-like RCC1 family protein